MQKTPSKSGQRAYAEVGVENSPSLNDLNGKDESKARIGDFDQNIFLKIYKKYIFT